MRKALLIALVSLALVAETTAQTWWPQNSTVSTDLKNINFYDDYYGFSFGDTLSTIVKTNVSGVVWNQLNPAFTDGDLRSSIFLGPQTIIAVGIDDATGKGLVMKSTDWGSTWLKHASVFDEKLFDIDYAGADAWICGSNGYIYTSGDGGDNWLFLPSVPTTENIYSIDFVNSNVGWCVGGVDTSAVILYSTDGGLFWQRQSSGITDTLYSVFFIDNSKGWAVGGAGTILSTTDAGNNWNQETSGTPDHLYDVCFINDTTGWAVGAFGTVLKTTDGGVNWNPENSGTISHIRSIIMRNDTLGWICGDSGMIKVYGNNPPSGIYETGNNSPQITLYPNPTTSQFTISGLTQYPAEISLFDITGREVLSYTIYKNEPVQVNDFPSGLYLWQVKTPDVLARGKLVKQ